MSHIVGTGVQYRHPAYLSLRSYLILLSKHGDISFASFIKIISIRQYQVSRAQQRILSAYVLGSLLCRVSDSIRLVPIRFWRMGHGRVVTTRDIVVVVGVASDCGAWILILASNTLSSSLTIFIYLPCCQCTEKRSVVSITKCLLPTKVVYIPISKWVLTTCMGIAIIELVYFGRPLLHT